LRHTLPAGHIAFATLASGRGLIAEAAGDPKTALGYVNDAVSISEAAMKAGKLGGDYVPLFLVRRAEVELQLGRKDEAERDAARGVNTLQKSMRTGVFSSGLGRAYLVMGQALEAEGKHDEAYAAFLSAAAHLQSTLGAEHPDVQKSVQLAKLSLESR
jgi:tetratricopeptide (TPR) repeat protein